MTEARAGKLSLTVCLTIALGALFVTMCRCPSTLRIAWADTELLLEPGSEDGNPEDIPALTQCTDAPVVAPIVLPPVKARVRLTGYQPHQKRNRPWIDRTGGGPNSAWIGAQLEDYHCAVSLPWRKQCVPYGTVCLVGSPVERYVLAVDCGPGVRANQIDLCFVWAKDYRAFIRAQGKAGRHYANVWPIRKLTKAEARTWTPGCETYTAEEMLAEARRQMGYEQPADAGTGGGTDAEN